ncbi:MAG: PLP-dependent aminotransferase family protein [Chloroflexi bacterium]|nr:PLP-dependent aminotransferase family protein [Chloroflexota bacterium]
MTSFVDSPIDPTLDTPLYWQLYHHLRAAILAGRLKQGMKLPSTRALADQLHVSRNTVLNAYEQLIAEGYLESMEASGTFVASVLPEQLLTTPARPALSNRQPDVRQPRLSKIGQAFLTAPAPIAPPPIASSDKPRAFRTGLPAFDAFPFDLWAKTIARQARHATGNALVYQDSAGYRPLREAIADHITVTRRVRCTADQIIIVAGSQGGLDLVARLLLNPGDAVWLEDPGYPGARGAFLGVGAQLVPVPVDQEGLMVNVGMARCPEARLVYLTPSHQFPLGVTMSLARRLAVLAWAKHAGAYILEDDYDSEYRFAGHALAALQGLDEAHCVIYSGTFSKVLFPALRLGYLVLPPPLVDVFLAARRFIDIHPPLLEQTALTAFISEGHFGRHLRRMRTLYAERRGALLSAMADLPLEIYASETGMHCVGWLPPGLDDQTVTRQAARHDVEVTPLSKFSITPMTRQGLLLGYAGIDESQIAAGARRLADALRLAGD